MKLQRQTAIFAQCCRLILIGTGAALAFAPSPGTAQVVIKLGTVAPEGSMWHDTLLEIRDEWRTISNGEVELRIYAGGVLGGEDEMVRKMQRRGLDALAVSGSGLPLIETIVDCLNLPLAFESYEQLDAVRMAIAPQLESGFERRGYKILTWAEAGWVHFFARSPVRTPDDLYYAAELPGPETTIVYTRVAPQDVARPVGRLAVADLGTIDERATVYVCGSARFADGASTVLLEAGVPEERIRVERFGPTG